MRPLLIALLVTPLGSPAPCVAGPGAAIAADEEKEKGAAFTPMRIEGWLVHADASLGADHPELLERSIDELENQLFQITLVLGPDVVAELREVPIWLRDDEKTGAIAFHPARKWLTDRGHHPPQEESMVEINARTLLRETRRQPWLVLHEMSHGYDWFSLGERRRYGNETGKAVYHRAMKIGRYERALHWDGRERKPYHATNRMEFFAETTEAYFGTNDIFPFVRAELRELDPATTRALEELWRVDRDDQRERIAEARRLLAPEVPRVVTLDDSPESAGSSGTAGEDGDLVERSIEGWTVRFHADIVGEPELDSMVRKLVRRDLDVIARYVPEHGVEKLRRIPIRVGVGGADEPPIAYHAASGPGEVRIPDARRYARLVTVAQSALFGVLARAYSLREIGPRHPEIERARLAAIESGRYERALRFDGERVQHPALSSDLDFFAELSRAAYGTADHEPFVRVELAGRDPETLQLLDRLWRGEIGRRRF